MLAMLAKAPHYVAGADPGHPDGALQHGRHPHQLPRPGVHSIYTSGPVHASLLSLHLPGTALSWFLLTLLWTSCHIVAFCLQTLLALLPSLPKADDAGWQWRSDDRRCPVA